MREPASITGKKSLLYESFADHRLPFMEFDCGDKKTANFYDAKRQKLVGGWIKKPFTCVLGHCFTFLLSV